MKRLKALAKSLLLGTLFCVPGSLLAQQNQAPAAEAVRRPTAEIAPGGCVTAQCHPAIKATPVVHAPVASDDCGSCHTLADAQKHTFTIQREKAELCTFCHEFDVAQMPVVHKPVTDGECLGCHNPHGGTTKALVVENSTKELCRRCHDDMTRDRKFLHGPVAQGACDSCHAPHASRFKNLLDAIGPDMCLTCHKEMGPALANAKFKHKAMDGGCELCHDPHGSNLPMSLPQEPKELCISCHQKTGDRIAAASVKHSAVTDGRTCLNCHSPHASNVADLQKDVTANTCMTCHDKPIKTAAGYTVAAVPEVKNPALHKHGEIKDGSCGGCHEVHGGARRNLLVKPYEQGFFQQFSASNFALCFPCHDVQLVETQKTITSTNFRNGDQNLHFVHANFGNRYKNCRTCHESHAASNDRLVREEFTFGKRQLPVRFTRTETGGTCAPGCHAVYPYDRVNAVPSSAHGEAKDAAAPAIPAIPRAQYQEAREISWTTRDIRGNEVNVPSGVGVATTLIFVSAEDAASEALVKSLRNAAMPEKASFVVIIGGKGAEAQSAKVAAVAGDWPVVVDAGNSAAQTLNARGWPLAIVLDRTGLEIARISGDGELLATRIRAYLQFAAGEMSRAQLDKNLAQGTIAEADNATQVARDLRAARALIEQGKANEAIAYLDDAKSTSPEAQIIRARALASMGKAEEALTIVDRLKPNSVPADEVDLVRARAWIDLDRWYQARPVLEQYVARKPGVAEAHMLLGRIYEHDQDFPKATAQYKAASEAQR